MNLVISQQEYYEDVLSRSLIEKLEESHVLSGDSIVYYKYPFVIDIDDKLVEPSILIVDKGLGVVIIDCDPSSESKIINDKLSCLDKIESNVLSKLMKSTSRNIKKERKKLCFPIISFAFYPNIANTQNEFDFQIEKDVESTIEYIKEHVSQNLNPETIKEIQSLIEGSCVIIKPKERIISEEDKSSKAYILKIMENQMALLDMEQKQAAISLLNEPQRIRGLAGSGKTIILCMKAAYLHLIHPDYKILYTFTTKSLYDYIERTITRFYKYLGDGNLPDFDKIQIKHAWGGKNVKGVYYDTSIKNGYIPVSFNSVKALMRSNEDVFDFVCQDLLEKSEGVLEKEYDFVLIDEAQDFKPSFYQLCRAIVKNDCMVWCYDDLQNIFDVQIQDTITTFENKYGAKGIDLVELKKSHEDIDNDIVLDKTYRNPREVLIVAHGIGFGIYNEPIIQKLESNSNWEQFGYTVEMGDCKTGSHMIISRSKEKSPLYISEKQKPEEIIETKSLKDKMEELQWVACEIEKNIKNDLLKPDDIVVISLDDINSKEQFEILYDLLNKKGIESYNLSSNNYLKGFIKENAVTLTTLYKAKGNEAGMVYVISADIFDKKANSRSMRNKVFTAFTRTKGWLRITGINCENGKLFTEIKTIIEKEFKFDFIQPNEAYALKNYKKGKKTNEVLKVKQKIMELEKAGFKQEDLMDLLFNKQLLDNEDE